MYTGVNYVLMCASVVVIGGLTMGLLYLFLREIGLIRLKRRQDMIDKLKKRRPAFSGQSGLHNRRVCHGDLTNNTTDRNTSLSQEKKTTVISPSPPPKTTLTSTFSFTTPDTPETVDEFIINSGQQSWRPQSIISRWNACR
ncbi:uncharacterized protein LOC143284230 [Babylonia areolata]|uniref:uncharacterized protein LOC143284230 n=1 Tax=Babylonia areolata TaxID=304850 RepID=UPI003FD4691D